MSLDKRRDYPPNLPALLVKSIVSMVLKTSREGWNSYIDAFWDYVKMHAGTGLAGGWGRKQSFLPIFDLWNQNCRYNVAGRHTVKKEEVSISETSFNW